MSWNWISFSLRHANTLETAVDKAGPYTFTGVAMYCTCVMLCYVRLGKALSFRYYICLFVVLLVCSTPQINMNALLIPIPFKEVKEKVMKVVRLGWRAPLPTSKIFLRGLVIMTNEINQPLTPTFSISNTPHHFFSLNSTLIQFLPLQWFFHSTLYPTTFYFLFLFNFIFLFL